MTAFAILAAVGYLALLVLFFRAVGRRLPGGRPQPRRTPANVARDLDKHRAARDLDTCRAIWPDPPSWRTAQAQHRIDTAKQQKEEQ